MALFSHTYFLLLALTVIVVMVNLLFGWSFVFYLPFIVGGVGSLVLYLAKKAKNVCNAFCASVYIIGAFLLLVFYDVNFFASWSFHVWIIPVLILSAKAKKDFVFMLLFLIGIFISLFILDLDGLVGRAITSIGMGSFWGFSFYFLLMFLTDIIKKEDNHENA